MSKTLLILAAGMGNRFGGLKQITPLGPNGEFIIDYSIYDAKKVGFDKVVFIIKEENYKEFKETIGKRVEPYINTEYVFQKNDNVPEPYNELLKTRTKPLGTAHAILCAKDKINEPFTLINADDFYGLDGFLTAYNYMENIPEKHYGLIAYRLGNTLPPGGKAKRGVCEANEKGELIKLNESKVALNGDMIDVSPLDGSPSYQTSKSSLVAMNFLVFTPDIFKILEDRFLPFLDQNKDNLEECEYLIPTVLDELVNEGLKTVDVIETSATWYGVTYKEDAEDVKKAILDMINNKQYPQNLWKE